MGKSQREKGKRGEREWAAECRKNGIDAYRGRQHHGRDDAPDVVMSIPFHVEVKRVERLQLLAAVKQAVADAGDKTPIVAHRMNGKPWLVTMLADDWFGLATAAHMGDEA